VTVTVADSNDPTCLKEYDVEVPAVCPPSNDNCANATTITVGSPITQDITNATNVENLTPCQLGGGGANCTGGTGTTDFGRGVWYVYTSVVAEEITVTASGFDTEIMVFSGSCGALACVGGDDDGGVSPGSSFCWTSTASFAPVDYYIYLDGHGTSVGTGTIEIGTVLPITVQSFDAEAMSKGNKVSWTTASEVNNQYQIIEKSSDGASNWSEVDRIESRGDSKTARSYEVMDMDPYTMTYYRIKSVDFDGYTEYSKVISLERKATTGKLNVFPNPTTDIITIETAIATSGNVTFTLVDLQGRIVSTETINSDAGAVSQSISLDGLSTGMYMLTVSTNNETFVQRVVKN